MIPLSCENPKLVRSGESKVLRVGDSQQNEGSRDFNIRYCDQQTNGGGWTVRLNQTFSQFKLIIFRSSNEEEILVNQEKTSPGNGKITSMGLGILMESFGSAMITSAS